MSWLQKLHETYEKNSGIAGKMIDGECTLLPIFHELCDAHIEVTLNEKGDILRTNFVEKEDAKTIIPCSESSAGRSGTRPTPHPLCDKLQYLAGDYLIFGGDKWHGYCEYMEMLKKWVDSPYSNRKLQGILKYIEKGTLINDLNDRGLIDLDGNRKMKDKWDRGSFPGAPTIQQQLAFIRWKVEIPLDDQPKVWIDRDIHALWGSYYSKSVTVRGVCQITGTEATLETIHPKKIGALYSNAKLISSNIDKGFVYSGRFTDAAQAYGVGIEASQKAHNALKWLIAKQGINKGNKTTLCWSVSNQKMPDYFADPFDLFGEQEESEDGYTGENLAYKLDLKMKGYYSNLELDDCVVIMGLEAATDGRLSITYYQEIRPEEYLQRIEHWHKTCSWVHNYKGSKEGLKRTYFIGAPSPKDIVETIFGDEEYINETLRERTISRISSCIIDKHRIPLDIVNMAIHRVLRREAFEDGRFDSEKNKRRFEKSLSIACALYNKYCTDYLQGGNKMSLDFDNHNRDYLFGRLLAVAQNTEEWALKKANEQRLTNADRMMQKFAERPFSTWRTIELSLRPSFSRLQGGAAASRERMIDEIMTMFDPEEFKKDTKLTGEFLLGYHSQRMYLMTKKQNDNEEE